MSTKAKAKKPKGSAATKKTGKKKPTASTSTTTTTTKKKAGDAKKTAPTKHKKKKKRLIADELAEQHASSTQHRRSIRNRNSSFNYEESSPESSAPSEDETPWRGRRRETVANKRAGGCRTKTAGGSSSNDNDSTKEETNNNNNSNNNWEIYNQGTTETDTSWNEHYRRLQEFHSCQGHSGVPIRWSKAPDFADWVSRQRQLFREIRAGYRIATTQEEGRWKRLQVLRFPLNYETWLWQRKYNELSEALNGRKYTADTTLPSSLREWVEHQKSLVNTTTSSMNSGGAHGSSRRIDSELKSNLEKLGVIIARNDSSEEASDDG